MNQRTTTSPRSLHRDDYHEHYNRILTSGVTTLRRVARAQHCEEPDLPSWRAFSQNHWHEALELNEQQRPAYTRHHQRMTGMGIHRRRLRLIDRITPYVQWECHVLDLRARCGDDIRVLDTKTFTENVSLPECVILGSAVLYALCFNAVGRADGAYVHTDPTVIQTTSEAFDTLYREAEPISLFFTREIAPLPPPLP